MSYVLEKILRRGGLRLGDEGVFLPGGGGERSRLDDVSILKGLCYRTHHSMRRPRLDVVFCARGVANFGLSCVRIEYTGEAMVACLISNS